MAPPPRSRTAKATASRPPPRGFSFPRDHASHAAYRTEWWYYTGHLRSGARRFGYQLTCFRVGVRRDWEGSRSSWAPHTVYFAHLALTDETRRVFRHHETASRPALGMAGADTARYRVWLEGARVELGPDGRTHRLRARAPDFSLALDLRPLKPPIPHGDRGLSQKSAGVGYATHYYSLTRLETAGMVIVGPDTLEVEGLSWMDHEYGSRSLAKEQVGWDWFSIQLDDGRELMLYLLRLRDGRTEPLSSGTWIEKDGTHRHLARSEFDVQATGSWSSRLSKATYPQGWRVRLPAESLELRLEPTLPDQELGGEPGRGVIYWEGSVRVTGTDRGRPVRGLGYVELTGYAGRVPGL